MTPVQAPRLDDPTLLALAALLTEAEGLALAARSSPKVLSRYRTLVNGLEAEVERRRLHMCSQQVQQERPAGRPYI